MKQETFTKWYEKYRKGTFVVIVKEKQFGDYVKRTKVVARFVNYYNTQESERHENIGNNAKENAIIPHVLKLNTNTQNVLLAVQKINHHKKHYTYFYQGIEIPKEMFYANVKERGEEQNAYSNYKLDEVISVGGIQ